MPNGKFCILNKPTKFVYAEVVTREAGSLEAGGLPKYPESLFVEIYVMKS
jgi:hypothetical protein